MASKRNISTRKPLFGQTRSKAFNTTKRTFKLNMQSMRFYVPELGQWVRVTLSTSDLKTVDKIGLEAFLQRQGRTLKSLL